MFERTLARRSALVATVAVMMAPMMLGAEGGCGPAFSHTPAPSMAGDWSVAYEDMLGVEITIGGAVYATELGATGGAFTIDHEGAPVTFDLDCTRQAVVCPSEVWPATVAIRQDIEQFPHRMFLQVPKQECDGTPIDANPAECGEGTLNPECAPVCMGEVVTVTREAFGVIDEAGESFTMLIGGGIATNGINCVLLGLSVATGDLLTTGSATEEPWTASNITNGQVVTGYSGGCLWAGDPDMDGELEALVLAATVKFTVGYSAAR